MTVTLAASIVAPTQGNALVAARSGGRIYPDTAPQGVAVPYVIYSEIATTPEESQDDCNGLDTTEIQFAAYADTTLAAVSLRQALRAAPHGPRRPPWRGRHDAQPSHATGERPPPSQRLSRPHVYSPPKYIRNHVHRLRQQGKENQSGRRPLPPPSSRSFSTSILPRAIGKCSTPRTKRRPDPRPPSPNRCAACGKST
ncbi:MAG: DUF3168 domain-containing protein [Opitutaceae bacterium]|nr:DUF3168 domain-containing protein [Opitutaceae bacterium]